MRSIVVWLGAVLMVGGLWSASVISQGLADEPAAPSSSSEATEGAAGNETGGSETVPPVVEGEPALPAEAGDVQARAVPQLVRIQNNWKPWQYVNIESGPVVAGPISVGWTSARWYLEGVAVPGVAVYRIRNVWKPDQYLNIESGALQASAIQPGWLSAQWTLEGVAVPGVAVYRIRNVWKPDQYLNIESGALQASAIQPGWLSAQWTLRFDATVVAAPPPPTAVTGAGTTGVTGTGTTDGKLAPPDKYTAPTANLSAVANGFSSPIHQRSLSTVIQFRPGLVVTAPVEISIGYYSPAGTERITQVYDAQRGNGFVHHDPEGDGTPRHMRADISFAERQPGGGVKTFAVFKEVDLAPLYDITISPFQFDLSANCDPIGKSDIKFEWNSPDNQPHIFKFKSSGYQRTIINGFNWVRTGVSLPHKLVMPTFNFQETGDIAGIFSFQAPIPPSLRPLPLLVPGRTQLFKGSLRDNRDEFCYANFQYSITYTLSGL